MSVYGDLLLAFPEQRRKLTVYKMTPKINGGWTADGESEVVTGLYQNSSGKHLKDSNGNLVQTAGFEFWTERGNLDGYFTQIKGNVYRLNSSNDWNYEGDFSRYSLEKVVGNDGAESVDITWNIGADTFS